MELDDRLKIVTPEGVAIELIVAGIGSRFIAGMLDITIQMLALMAIGQAVTFGLQDGFAAAVAIVTFFLVLFAYPILFEVLNQGRTPGKLAVGIRVVRIDGSPIRATGSVLRNVLRLIDGWIVITFFLFPVGFITAFVTKHAQRLGDLAAGTVVIRDRLQTADRIDPTYIATPRPADVSWDVTGVTADEIFVTRRYLERRGTLPMNARIQLSHQLAERVRAHVPGLDPSVQGEQVLEWVLARKDGRVDVGSVTRSTGPDGSTALTGEATPS